MASALLDLDPTGTLSAVGAGVSLVGAALRLGTAAKKLNDSRHPTGGGAGAGAGAVTAGGGVAGATGGPSNLHRAQTNPADVPIVPKDPERERRAYETVNFVLRELGSRICAAGMVDEHALTKALTAATQHIEVNLFSGEANRLFESLAPKLDDPILVNSVFTSIYFIGALSAELATSLPNYKDTYTPVGPRLVQQLFRAAIGEDAFRDNLSANLDAYKTLTTTAGLLRPTDIGYATFPRFPSFSPCKYSGRGFSDVRTNKMVYEKLVKHFDRVGFPQPTLARQVEVGSIRDWKFLWGDSNSRAFDVDKADKNIGENFGRVVHWLICNADRLPPGTAVVAYYDQHIELIRWIQHRMGYAVLYPATDLDLSGPHLQLERRLRLTLESWVILMPSTAAQAAKRANAEHWMSTHILTAARAAPFAASKTAAPRPTSMAIPQSTRIPDHPPPPPQATTTGDVPPVFAAHADVPSTTMNASVNRGFSPPAEQSFPQENSVASFSSAQNVPYPTQGPFSAAQSIPYSTSVAAPTIHTTPAMAQAIPPGFQGDAPPVRQPSQTSNHSASGASFTHSTNRAVTTVPTSPPMSSASSPPRSPAAVEMPTQGQYQFFPKTVEQQVEEIDQQFQSALVPQFQRLWASPSADAGIRESQCKVLDHTLERETIDRLDRIEIPEGSPARYQRKRLIDQAQELMDFLPTYKELGPSATHGRPLPGALQIFAQQQTAPSTNAVSISALPYEARKPVPPPSELSRPAESNTSFSTNAISQKPEPLSVPYPSESSRPSESNTSLSTNTIAEKPKTAPIRRKAPPPPKKFISAKAIYDFEPDPGNEEELGFNEDDDIEIVEKTAAMDEDGWCKARIKGSQRVGLVPLEYLKIEEKKPRTAAPAPVQQPPPHTVPPTDGRGPQSLTRGISVGSNSTTPSHTHQSSGTPAHVPSSLHSQPSHIPTQPPSAYTHSQPVMPLPHHPPPSSGGPPPQSSGMPSQMPSKNRQQDHTTHSPPPATTPAVNLPGMQSHGAPPMHHQPRIPPLLPQPTSVHPPSTSHSPQPPAPHETLVHSLPPGQPGIPTSSYSGPHGDLRGVSSASSKPNTLHNSQLDTVGLTTAAVGTVTGVGALLKGIGKLESEEKKHSHGGIGHPGQSLHGSDVAGGQSSVIGYNNNGTVTASDAPPVVDLSAFGQGPFDPRNAMSSQEQYYVPPETFSGQANQTNLTASSTSNYVGVPSSPTTEVFQDTTSTTNISSGQETGSSPFASLATTSNTDTTTFTDATVTSGDGVTSTYESYSDDQTYSVDDTGADDGFDST